MDTCATVKIKHPGGYAIINESDFDPHAHELFDAAPSYSVGKGPGGKFYVKAGKKAISEGFDTSEDAEAKLASMTAG